MKALVESERRPKSPLAARSGTRPPKRAARRRKGWTPERRARQAERIRTWKMLAYAAAYFAAGCALFSRRDIKLG